MESIRKIVLQAELDRIEREAQAKSYAIMNKADELASAAAFCALMNDCPELQDDPIKPTISYNPQAGYACHVSVYVIRHERIVLRRAAEVGLSWDASGNGLIQFEAGFERVRVLGRVPVVRDAAEAAKS